MKSNITPELKERIAKSVEAHKIASENLAKLIEKGNYVYAKPYVSKPEPIQAYTLTARFKSGIAALERGLAK